MNELLKGFNQYFKDNRNRMVYYVPKTKTAYFVDNRQSRLVGIFHQRFSIAILVGIIMAMYKVHLAISIGSSILFYLMMEYILKYRMLPNMSHTSHYDIIENTRQQLTFDTINNKLRWLYLQIGLAIVFIVVTFIAKDQQEEYQTILLILLGIYFLFNLIRNVIYLRTQKETVFQKKKL